MSNTFVCLMGMGTVFTGLICIIILCTVMSAVIRLSEKNKKAQDASANSGAQIDDIPDKQKLIAAVSAVLAEELGTDVNAIRIHSFKKI